MFTGYVNSGQGHQQGVGQGVLEAADPEVVCLLATLIQVKVTGKEWVRESPWQQIQKW